MWHAVRSMPIWPPCGAPAHLELNMPRVLNGALDVAGAVSESGLSLALHKERGGEVDVADTFAESGITQPSECAIVARIGSYDVACYNYCIKPPLGE